MENHTCEEPLSRFRPITTTIECCPRDISEGGGHHHDWFAMELRFLETLDVVSNVETKKDVYRTRYLVSFDIRLDKVLILLDGGMV